MTYSQAIEFLYSLRLFGAKLGLENTLRLAALAGNPQHGLRFIHVAGTNGKGSTCAFLESIYRSTGLRVGLFTSPHLVTFRERFQVNLECATEAEVAELVREMQPLLAQFDPAHHPTFFEVVTVMALQHFSRNKCDLVIWETGMGGRLDATNIVTPLASLITNVQWDHEQWLGYSLGKIAGEKAGIIKHGCPVITAAHDPEPLEIIRRIARDRAAPLRVVTAADLSRPPLADTSPGLAGLHQRMNAALAVACVETLLPQLPVTDAQLRRGLAETRWPGRLQLVPQAEGGKILLDGAHNPAGAAILALSLPEFFPGKKPILILGMLKDKNCAAMCDVLAPAVRQIFLVPVQSDRSAPAAELHAMLSVKHPLMPVTICASLAAALQATIGEESIVVAGSLYLVGEAMEYLKLLPCPGSSERGLNEWSVKP
jgi:dihydrofolate synthase/folylpolyglutamate synthase